MKRKRNADEEGANTCIGDVGTLNGRSIGSLMHSGS